MTKRLLIDATYPDETRIAVVDGTKLEEFDFELASRKQLKSNIYLAKVTRVEPSLQAAFVEYGGNRHGFLAFSEIHPDYYRLPMADRPEHEEGDEELPDFGAVPERSAPPADEDEDEDAEEPVTEAEDAPAEAAEDAAEESPEEAAPAEEPAEAAEGEAALDAAAAPSIEGETEAEELEVIGGDEVEEARPKRPQPSRDYKIQEVVKRRQIMLVQVNKEERGTKGAALTTYLSLAGRYCVLMPNTPRGGGVSRKITNVKDRKRMKDLLSAIEVPEGMSVILRTAGMERSKAEIRRDLEFLLRQWDDIRGRTLQSTAPSLIHEEGNLVKRAIRDLYARDIDEVWVAGDEAYRVAKDFMKMVTPSHAKRVQPYKDEVVPLFQRFQVESQIDAIHEPSVQLPSGGYIVINQTEALVAIDVNSGKATRERHIEETALKTNLEASVEIARQLRLRDLAGLIVIDFIDMEENRNNAAVERKLKEAMKHDRARIQLGRISPFGLLELSRQRLRPSLVETNFETCALCRGLGITRSVESTALQALRAIEEEGLRQRAGELQVVVPATVAVHILNHKRGVLTEIETRYGIRVFLRDEADMKPGEFRVERVKGSGKPTRRAQPQPMPALVFEPDEAEEAEETPVAADADDGDSAGEGEGDRRKRRRRRRRRGGRRDDETQTPRQAREGESGEEAETRAPAEGDSEGDGEGDGGEPRRRRRRGRRGGRRRREGQDPREARGDAHQSGDHAQAEPANSDHGPNGGDAPRARIGVGEAEPMPPRVKPAPRAESAPAEISAVAEGGGETPRKGWWQKLLD